MPPLPKKLIKSLQTAYSAERAACFAYVGHAASLKDKQAKLEINQIEQDEWDHRAHVLTIMNQYNIPVSRFKEIKFYYIGKIIGLSCHIIGRFMPYFFAGKLESGNVCEYFVMIHHFHTVGITQHDPILYEMGIKEKEHEMYFLEMVKDSKWFPYFEKVFAWGKNKSANDIDLNHQFPIEDATQYCKKHKSNKP